MSEASDSIASSRRIFTGEPQYETFARMQVLNPVREMTPSRQPFQ